MILLSIGTAQIVVRPAGVNVDQGLGPVSLVITSPETGPGLGPKYDVDQEFQLAFNLVLANLTLTNVMVQVFSYDPVNETYGPMDDGWIVHRANASWPLLVGPSVTSGIFAIRMPERGYYFLKIRATFELDGRTVSSEAGDMAFGPRIRIVPGLSQWSYSVILGMPVLPVVVGLVVRSARRRETRKRRRASDPEWLLRLREDKGERA